MINAHNLPQWLWFSAVCHAAYLQNRAYTKALETETPYQSWKGNKPNVAHLCEFSVLVYILRQGQYQGNKMEKKTKRPIFIGLNNENKSVKYYALDTTKIPYSQNYKFLSNAKIPLPPMEDIKINIMPNVLCEEELDKSMPKKANGSTPKKSLYKQMAEGEDEDIPNGETMHLRKHPKVDYNQLNKLVFPDELEDNKTYLTSSVIVYAIFAKSLLGGDEPKSLREAKSTPEWPKWEEAVGAILGQLAKMNTCELVECPDNMVLIPNKWVLVRKYNKAGKLVKYKARLVVKGCAQCLGFDYDQTFAPVIRLETI